MRNREGHFGAVSQERVDASASINEGGTAEDFKSFRPLLNSEETGAFLVSIRPLQDTLVSPTEIRRNSNGSRIYGKNRSIGKKTEALFTPVPKFTAVWQTHGIMALWV